MRTIMESAFAPAYLVTACILGILTLKNAKGRKVYILLGITALILAGGDAFHLVPRVLSLNASDAGRYAAALGFGTLVTSITMTVFYVLLFHVWQLHYGKKSKVLGTAVYTLALVRIILCLFPQNNWFSSSPPWIWGLYRNIPFTLLGVLIIALFFTKAKQGAKSFRFMWLAISLSFAFYIPVVLFVDTVPLIGLLMLPKTLMYVWIILMGYRACLTVLRPQN